MWAAVHDLVVRDQDEVTLSNWNCRTDNVCRKFGMFDAVLPDKCEGATLIVALNDSCKLRWHGDPFVQLRW